MFVAQLDTFDPEFRLPGGGYRGDVSLCIIPGDNAVAALRLLLDHLEKESIQLKSIDYFGDPGQYQGSTKDMFGFEMEEFAAEARSSNKMLFSDTVPYGD